ncbi:MAG TPA: histidinol dehydrogenase [Acidobacteriota bacterium]|mgnify:FL=1|nr:histidinol dehydrogenase [Acidobacteriota bacterium]HQF86302.1 histidinol dehydrogenase [Acidobacteriota bacterium]HQG90455.1 histidinol dehydrogenase [Acidobacteriota bacterium]
MIRMVDIYEALEWARQPRLPVPPPEVAQILDDIRSVGDDAVRRWARRLDGHPGDDFEVSRKSLQAALDGLDRETRALLEDAARRIRTVAACQRELFTDLSLELDGVVLGHRVMPVTRVACYAPGGRYPLPSSVLMGVIPAREAGVKEIVVLSPRIHPVTLAAAAIAGADRVFNIGGVQGVAAAAWGLAGLPRVDLIVGPGNRFVTAAKQALYGQVGIEFPAGPSELLILADRTADPVLLAADLLAQAEHDPDALPVLASPHGNLLERVQQELVVQLETLPAASPSRVSVSNGMLVRVSDWTEAVELADRMAPEHLELAGPEAEALADLLTNYGSLFIGSLSAEVFGDYGSGTNHILPTSGAARFTGGVWVGTFLRILTRQRVRTDGLPALVHLAEGLAQAESLPAHASSARLRTERRANGHGLIH